MSVCVCIYDLIRPIESIDLLFTLAYWMLVASTVAADLQDRTGFKSGVNKIDKLSLSLMQLETFNQCQLLDRPQLDRSKGETIKPNNS